MTKDEEEAWRRTVYTAVCHSSKRNLRRHLGDTIRSFKDHYGREQEAKRYIAIEVITEILENRGVCKHVCNWYKTKETP